MHKYSNDYSSGPKDIRVGVVGGSGYAGVELVRILQKHPRVWLRACFSTNPELSFGDFLPNQGAKGIPVIDIKDIGVWAPELHTIFLATPAEISLELAPQLLKAGAHVVDLSGAFRLQDGTVADRVKAYEQWYQLAHPCPELLDRAEYGLVPWLAERPVVHSEPPRLIANPGCYSTSVLMAILPLLKRGLIDPSTLVVDAKSGASGAGRKASSNLLFSEVEGECLPYRVGKHQHLPEIRSFAEKFSGQAIDPMFSTNLLCIRRGIISSIFAKTAGKLTEQQVSAAFAEDYSTYGMVEWGALNQMSPRAAAFALSLKRVVGTGLTRALYQLDDDRIYLFSLIDNLIKGAAGQAVENFNRLLGIPVGTGVDTLEGVL